MSDTTPSTFEGKYKFEKEIDVQAAKLKIQTEASSEDNLNRPLIGNTLF